MDVSMKQASILRSYLRDIRMTPHSLHPQNISGMLDKTINIMPEPLPIRAASHDVTHWHHLKHGDVARLLDTVPKTGLSQEEADRRIAIYGPNSVSARRGQPA